MPYKQTASGFRLWVTPSGNALLRDAGGNIYNTSLGEAEQLVRSGQYHPASPEQGRDFDKDLAESRETIGEKAVTLGKAVAAGIPDAGTGAGRALQAAKAEAEKRGFGGVVRAAEALAPAAVPGGVGLGLSMASQVAPAVPYEEALSGRAIQENVAALAGAARGEESEVAAREWRQQAQEEARRNPLLTELGYAGGQVLGSALTPGLGEFMAAKGGLGLAARMGLGAIEGGAAGAAQQGEDAYIKDYDLTSEQTLAGAGLASVLAGTTILGLHGAGRLWRRLGSRGATAFEAAQPGAVGAGKGAAKEVAADFLGKEPSAEAVELAQAGIRQEPAKALAVIEKATNTYEQKVDALIQRQKTALQQLEEDVSAAVRPNRDMAVKSRHMASLEERAPEQLETFRNATYRELNAMSDAVEAMRADPQLASSAYGRNMLKREILPELQRRMETVAQAKDYTQVWSIADDTKRLFQDYSIKAQDVAHMSPDKLNRAAAADAGRRFAEMQQPLLNMLEDPAIVGERAAQAQAAINRRWTPYLGDLETGKQGMTIRYREALMERKIGQSEWGDFSAVRDSQSGFIDHRKLTATMRGWSDEANRDVRDLLLRQPRMSAELVAAIKQHQALTGEAASAAQRVPSLVREVEKNYAELANLQEWHGDLQRMAGAQSMLMREAGGVLGAVKGVANTVARRLRGKITEEIDGAAAPSYRRAGSAEVRQRVQARTVQEPGVPPVSERVPAPAYYRQGSKAAAAVAGGIGVAETTRRLVTPKAQDGADSWREQAELVTAMRDDPEEIMRRSSAMLGSMPATMPNLSARLAAKAAVGAQYLASTLGPMIPPRSPLQPNLPLPKLSESDQKTWDRIWDAVNSPDSVLHDWRTGRVKQDQMDALRAVWPAIYADLRQHAAEQIAARKTPLPYAQRRNLDMLLGLNGALEPTLSPGFLAATDQWFQQTHQQLRQPMAPRATTKAPDTAHLYDLHNRET